MTTTNGYAIYCRILSMMPATNDAIADALQCSAYQAAKKEAEQLRAQIKALKDKGKDVTRLANDLRRTQEDLVNLQLATGYRRRFRTAFKRTPASL